MITITACATAVCLMNQLPISLGTVIPFIMTLGIAMVASPGRTRRLYHDRASFPVHGFRAVAGDPEGPICAIMVALYITRIPSERPAMFPGIMQSEINCRYYL